MKMRQAANHPYLVVYGRNRQAADHVDVCGVCQEEAEDPVMAKVWMASSWRNARGMWIMASSWRHARAVAFSSRHGQGLALIMT
jgi:hypothetical protein